MIIKASAGTHVGDSLPEIIVNDNAESNSLLFCGAKKTMCRFNYEWMQHLDGAGEDVSIAIPAYDGDFDSILGPLSDS